MIASAHITIADLNDPIQQGTAPASPVSGMLWLDTSLTPPLLKRYTGTGWEVVNDSSALETAIANAQTAADNAQSYAEGIADGTNAIEFANSTVGSVTLNSTDGLKITGLDGTYFQVKNNAMGFFDTNNSPLFYYDNGHMILTGGAKIGGANGWTIGSGSMYSGTASSLDAAGGIYLGTDGISVTSGSAHFSTSDFVVDINDGSQQFSMDANGASMSSLSVENLSVTNLAATSSLAGAYSGPTTIYVKSSYEYDPEYPNRVSTLQAAFNMLNNKILVNSVSIIVQSSLSEIATLKGVMGSGAIHIDVDNEWQIYGGIDIHHCNATIFIGTYRTANQEYVQITSSRNQAVRIWACSYVVLDCVTINGYGNTSGISGLYITDGAKVSMRRVTLRNSYNLIYVTGVSDLDCYNIRGGDCTNFLYGDGARITWSGTRPDGSVNINFPCVTSPDAAGLAALTVSTSGTAPTPASVGQSTLTATLTGSYASGWGSNTTIVQGIYGNYNNVGCMWFDATAFAGKTIDSAVLTIKRSGTRNGSGSAVEVRMCVVALSGKSGNPKTSTSGSTYLVGSVALGGTINVSGNNLATMIQAIADSANNGAAYGLMLTTNDTAAGSHGYSDNYAVFEGTEGTAPELTVNYH